MGLLSVVIPVYNEAATVRPLVQKVAAIREVAEMIVVDDGSGDGTRTVLEGLKKEYGFRLLAHERNRGKGAAIRTGLRHATAPYTVVQDADLEYDPADYPRLLAPLLAGKADVVYGSRYRGCPEAEAWHTLVNRCLTFLSNLVNRRHLTDMETCYKVFPTKLLRSLPLRCDRFGFEPEVTALLSRRGARIAEVPVSYRRRGYREGKKIGPWDAVKTVAAILLYGLS